MSNKAKKGKFLFTVDIMIEAETNGQALEALLHLLNTGAVEDYHIKQGVELGNKIAAARQEAATAFDIAPEEAKPVSKVATPVGTKTASAPKAVNPSPPDGAPAPTTASAANDVIWMQIRKFQQNNMLIRLSVLKGKGVKLSIPCRIVNADQDNGNVTVYHVDEKKVYTFKINEIDDFEIR